MNKVSHFRRALLAIMALPFVLATANTGSVFADGSGASCQEISRAVALGPGQPANQIVHGTFCSPTANETNTLDILVPGATYDRTYWDFGFQTPQYSYLQQTLQAGRSALAYDRIGTGQSSRPLSALVTLDADAYVLHQLVDWARTTQNFAHVDIIGHSMGSIIGVNETATYNDADRLILTGFLHTITPGHALAGTTFYPALLDPQFSSTLPDSGYLTTIPGTRHTLFYSAAADPNVIAYDEAHKAIVSGPGFAEGVTQLEAPAALNISQGVHIPVLEIAGAQDFLACVNATVNCNDHAALQSYEQAYFTHAPSLSVATVADTGHDLTTHPSNTVSFQQIDSWIATH